MTKWRSISLGMNTSAQQTLMLNLAQTLLHNAKKGKVCKLLKWCVIQTLHNKLGTLNI
jgi:hypothetical protein